MKYTKDFEKYWTRAKQDIDVGTQWYKLKEIAFLSWKAGIDKTKRDYDLIQHKSMEPSKFFF